MKETADQNKKTFSSSKEVFDWLSNFINLERGQKPKSFRLDRMETLSELAGNPQKCAPSIHIAGSKGKGSVTGMITSILTSAGFRAARYMSPHVIDIRERLCLGDSYFSEEVYVSAGNELKNITENLLPASKNPLFDAQTQEGAEPTFWELLTLLFFLCSRRANCDIMVVETGLGGRLDSTNILEPLVSVITLIELEHTGMLGNTITAVAGEKAGIIKQDTPLVLAKQCEEALKVFKKVTEEKNSQLLYLPQIAEISNIKITKQVTDFILTFKSNSKALSLSIPIPGKVQAENASLAIAAINAAVLSLPASRAISEDTFRDGLKNLNIPGRFERLTVPGGTPPFIIDGAHTPESLDLCIETFCSLYGEGGVLLFGCAADKDATAMAKIAHSHFTKIIITTPGTFKVSDSAKVHEVFAQTAGHEKTQLITDTHSDQDSARICR